ncbi:GNAT family N-acetyltransferase [Fulvimonas soli]|jgi:ribosomal protein S18 acetylase RimI-like enzyme|uniref:Ribosomal protein S18 acetylase RimI-like enzyme n=1 Tax=Fulvimonas soli TaxID=155197 RepID=A0A316IK65_9GAMM|nr:GNAT family N-acetyltransferase [Fulvimonas soli]PWK87602.1 ribosomal protein S18 acetylase RimI-like enzyme [Fulvimonas soli]TNY26778.1 GNAT family N-acetyltransferase [Fulvimonas soli]
MSFQIQQATIHDLDALAPLFDGYRQFYGQPPDLARARDFLAARFAHHESLLLLARGAAGEGLGFTQLYPLFSSVRTARTYLLNDLFVAAAARRRGVAKALLLAAAGHARALGAAGLSLSTGLDNRPAQALYESLGWQRERQFCEYTLAL